MNNRLLGSAALCLLLGTAACGDQDPVGVDPDPPETCTPQLPSLGALPAFSAPLASSPRNLPQVGVGIVSDRFVSELWVHGRYAYTGSWGTRGGNSGNEIKIWDVSGNTPMLVGSETIERASTLGDVQVSDDGKLLLVATEGGGSSGNSVVLFDLADPVKPRQVARYNSPNTAAGVHTAELARVKGRLYAFLSIDPAPSRLVILDLVDPANPREVFTQAMGNPFIHDVFVRDGLLFTALWNDGTTVWDIGGAGCGTPANPVQIVNVRTVGGQVHNIWWLHDPQTGSKRYMFVGQEGPGVIGSSSVGDIHVVDLADPAGPREVAFFNVPGAGTHNFSVDEASGILYAAYYNAGVRALDVRGNLGSCSADQKAPDGRCDLGKMGREVGRGLTGGGQVYVWGVQHVGPHVYASDMLNGLWKLESLRR